MSWHPNSRQWMVIWATFALSAWRAFQSVRDFDWWFLVPGWFPGSEEYRFLSVTFVVFGALLVWRLNGPPRGL